MKKIFLILSLFASLSLQAQFVTTFAKNIPETQEDGVVYYLPRNVIKLEFTIEETNYFIGPYAEFASSMLGISDFIRENKTEYNIKDVDIQIANEKDPNVVYYISLDEKSKEPLPDIILDDDGVILAVGYENIPADLKISRNTFNYNELNDCAVENVSFYDILDNEIENDDDDDDEEGIASKKITKEDRAKAVVGKIVKIRKAHFDLVSGYQEIAYGDVKYMAEAMKALEDEYICLFKGKVSKKTYKKTVYVTPEKNQMNTTVAVARISSTEGFVESNGKGDLIKIQYDSNYSLTNVTPISDESKNANQINRLFYRIPVETNVKVLFGTNVLTEKLLEISQFGDIRTISSKNNKILFNPNTGQVISITK